VCHMTNRNGSGAANGTRGGRNSGGVKREKAKRMDSGGGGVYILITMKGGEPSNFAGGDRRTKEGPHKDVEGGTCQDCWGEKRKKKHVKKKARNRNLNRISGNTERK